MLQNVDHLALLNISGPGIEMTRKYLVYSNMRLEVR